MIFKNKKGHLDIKAIRQIMDVFFQARTFKIKIHLLGKKKQKIWIKKMNFKEKFWNKIMNEINNNNKWF